MNNFKPKLGIMKKTFTLIILSLYFANLKAQVPVCATNVSPANTTTNVSPTPYITLKWNPVPGAVLYNVYLEAKLPPTILAFTSVAVRNKMFLSETPFSQMSIKSGSLLLKKNPG